MNLLSMIDEIFGSEKKEASIDDIKSFTREIVGRFVSSPFTLKDDIFIAHAVFASIIMSGMKEMGYEQTLEILEYFHEDIKKDLKARHDKVSKDERAQHD